MKHIWTHPMFLLIRMGFIFYILKAAVYFYYGEPFLALNEIWLTLIIIVAFWAIYCLAVALDYKRLRSSPFLLSETIQKEIYKVSNEYVTIAERRGLYKATKPAGDAGVTSEYKPVADPAVFKGKLLAYREMLYTLNNASADDLLKKVDKLMDETDYMIEHPDAIPQVIQRD